MKTTEYVDTNNSLAMLVGQQNPTGLRTYSHGPGGVSLGYRTTTAGGTAISAGYFTHALGSVTNIIDNAGAVAGTYRYNPYGALRTASSITGPFSGNVLRYTGQQQDPTGRYNLRARQYNPTTGAFSQTDPMPYGAGHAFESSYVYAGGSPTTLVDVRGLRKSLPDVRRTVKFRKGDKGPNFFDGMTGGEPSDYQDFVARVSMEAGIDPVFAYAILLHEHGGDFPGKNQINAAGERFGVADSLGVMNVTLGAFKTAMRESGGTLRKYAPLKFRKETNLTKLWEGMSDIGPEYDQFSIASGIWYLKALDRMARGLKIPKGYTRTELVAMAYNAGEANIFGEVRRGKVGGKGDPNTFGDQGQGYLWANSAVYDKAFNSICDNRHRSCVTS